MGPQKPKQREFLTIFTKKRVNICPGYDYEYKKISSDVLSGYYYYYYYYFFRQPGVWHIENKGTDKTLGVKGLCLKKSIDHFLNEARLSR